MALIYSYYVEKLLLVNPSTSLNRNLYFPPKFPLSEAKARERKRNYKIEYLSEDHIRNYKINKIKSNNKEAEKKYILISCLKSS